jgi:hypothetical protein
MAYFLFIIAKLLLYLVKIMYYLMCILLSNIVIAADVALLVPSYSP